MKTMIEVYRDNGENTVWIALDEIEKIRERNGLCRIITDCGSFYYRGTIEHLAQATRSAADVRGEVRLIGLESSHG